MLNLVALRSGDVVESDLIAVEHLAARLHRMIPAPSRDWRGRFQAGEGAEDLPKAAEVLEAFVARCRRPDRS